MLNLLKKECYIQVIHPILHHYVLLKKKNFSNYFINENIFYNNLFFINNNYSYNIGVGVFSVGLLGFILGGLFQ